MAWKKDKIRKLIDCLESLTLTSIDEFNLTRFCTFNYKCGTTACALGWFCYKNPNETEEIKEDSFGYFFEDYEDGDEEDLFDAIFGFSSHKSKELYGKQPYHVTKEEVIVQLKKLL